MVAEKKISRRRACRWRSRVRVGMSRNALQEPAVVKDKDMVLKAEIESLAHRHKQWGVKDRSAYWQTGWDSESQANQAVISTVRLESATKDQEKAA